MHMLLVFAHSKFRGVAQDFYMSTVPVKEPVNLANFYFANAGPLPSPELHKMKSLYAEDYIYIVYKYMQENDKI